MFSNAYADLAEVLVMFETRDGRKRQSVDTTPVKTLAEVQQLQADVCAELSTNIWIANFTVFVRIVKKAEFDA